MKNNRSRWCWAIGVSTLLFMAFLNVVLMANVVEEESPAFRDVANGLRCPTCTGISVLESDAPFSVQIKNQVKEQMDKGKSREEILQFFVERYGPWILREPPKQGFHILAWAVPVIILVMGPLLVWFFVWRHRVVMDSYGVRSAEVIVAEMEQQLEQMRQGRG